MTNDDKQKRIDDYLLGKLGANDRREFEEETSRNAELSQQLADTKLAMDAIELAEDAALKARLQKLESSFRQEAAPVAAKTTAVIKELPTPGTKKTGVQPRRNLRQLYAIAAAVLVLLLAGWYILRPTTYDSPEALAMATFEPYQNIVPGTVRGGDTDPAADAYAAYDAGRFAAAATALRALPATPVNRFYLGQSLMADGDFTAAATEFAELRTADFGLAPEATYYLALARIGEGRLQEAREILTKISIDPDHLMNEDARTLLLKADELD